VQAVTPPIIGLQATTARILALPMKVGAASIMVAERAVIAIRKICKLRHAQNVMMRIQKARVGDTIEVRQCNKARIQEVRAFVTMQ
jgi:hypothetical protein